MGGSLSIEDSGSAGSVDLGNLTDVGGDVTIEDNGSAGSVDLSSLTDVGGDVEVDCNENAAAITLTALETIGGSLFFTGNTDDEGQEDDADKSTVARSLGAVSFADLVAVGGDVVIADNRLGRSVDLGALRAIGGALFVLDNADGTGVALPNLETVGGAVIWRSTIDPVELASPVVAGDLLVDTLADRVAVRRALGETSITQGGEAFATLTLPADPEGASSTIELNRLSDPGPLAVTLADGTDAVLWSLAALQLTAESATEPSTTFRFGVASEDDDLLALHDGVEVTGADLQITDGRAVLEAPIRDGLWQVARAADPCDPALPEDLRDPDCAPSEVPAAPIPEPMDTGCGCRTSGSSVLWLGGLLPILAMRRSRRARG